jgi:TIR domain/Pentapeptide repeats (8 copies)
MEREVAYRFLIEGPRGVEEWNRLRASGENPISLSGIDLGGIVLSGVNLSRLDLSNSCFAGANLSGADLRTADLRRSDLRRADLRGADLSGARLSRADLSEARCGGTSFYNLDLGDVEGVDKLQHHAPSFIGMDTISRSRGRIPDRFLLSCGLADWELLSARFYDAKLTPLQFCEVQTEIFNLWTRGRGMINGCFISYSWADEKFVDRLYDRLSDEGFKVWQDRHDLVAGVLQDQIWRAIQIHHVVILVLSQSSVKSDWVENELDMARNKEKEEGRPVLCPISLDDAWKKKVDAKSGPGDPSRPLWRTLTQKNILDFSDQTPIVFDEMFRKLVTGLKLYYGPKKPRREW